MTQRRRQVDQQSSAKSQNDSKSPPEIKRHRSSLKIKSSSRYLKYVLFLILIYLFYLGTNHLLIPILFTEQTNEPLNVPKLVDQEQSAPERFWGTYR